MASGRLPLDRGGPGQQDQHPQGGQGDHHQPKPTYSSKLKLNVNRCERLKCNVLEIRIESDSHRYANLDSDTIAKLIAKLGIDIQTQTEGFQTGTNKIFIWLKENLDIDGFVKKSSSG